MTGILEQVVEAPQRSAAVPDGSGCYAIFQEATHSLSTHETTAATLVLEVKSGKLLQLPSEGGSKNFIWIEPTTNIIWQKRVEKTTELWTSNAKTPSKSYRIACFSIDAVLFQVVQLANGDLGALLYTSKISGESKGYPKSTGRVFTSFPFLTFDQGIGRPAYQLLFLRIPLQSSKNEEPCYALSNSEPVDVNTWSSLEFFPYSGSMPNISTPNCAISPSGIAFVAQGGGMARGPGSFSSQTYFVPLPGKNGGGFEAPTHLSCGSCNGWSALPVFSRDGRSLAFLKDVDERMIMVDRSIFVVRDVLNNLTAEPVRVVDEKGQQSHLLPESVQWGPDGKRLYFLACDTGRAKLFGVDADGISSPPTQVAPVPGRPGSVLAASVSGDPNGLGRCLLMETSLTSPNRLFDLNLASNILREIPDQKIPDFGLSPDQVSEEWFESEDHKIHTFIMRPSNFDASKKYPMALIIHGGPVASWLDAFHLYWTLPLFAEHGYVLVMPNYTGSTGYTREFRQAAYGDFGGAPYRDLIACMDWIESSPSLSYIDSSRAVSLGGSFGGYMNLWLAGQPLGRRFKALWLHAPGGFGNTSFYTSDMADVYPRILTRGDEEYKPENALETVARWDPAAYAKNWRTPMLFTHGEKDLRCPASNSVAAFAHCQTMGVESKLVVFPDESHFILKPENNYHWHKEVFEWMDRFVKE